MSGASCSACFIGRSARSSTTTSAPSWSATVTSGVAVSKASSTALRLTRCRTLAVLWISCGPGVELGPLAFWMSAAPLAGTRYQPATRNVGIRGLWGERHRPVPEGPLRALGFTEKADGPSLISAPGRARRRRRAGPRAARTPPARGSRSTPASAGRRRTGHPATRSRRAGSRAGSRGSAPRSPSSRCDQLLGRDVVGDQPAAVRLGVPRLVDGPVAPRLVDLLAEEAPHEPALLHVQHVAEQLDRRPARRQPRRTPLVLAAAPAPSSTMSCAHPVQVRRPAGRARRPVLARLAVDPGHPVVVAHAAIIALIGCPSGDRHLLSAHADNSPRRRHVRGSPPLLGVRRQRRQRQRTHDGRGDHGRPGGEREREPDRRGERGAVRRGGGGRGDPGLLRRPAGWRRRRDLRAGGARLPGLQVRRAGWFPRRSRGNRLDGLSPRSGCRRSSQCSATFLLGCTRGGSPGILG